MREIVIDLSQNSFSCPLLFGGYEGEHKNTKLSIVLPPDLLPANIEKEIRYKFVFQTPIGELISSPYISADEITDNKISTILWGQLLKHRGDLIGCVAAVADLSGEEVELIAKTSSFKLKISDSPTGVDIVADTAENRDFISEVTKSYLDTVLNLFVDKDYVDTKLEAALGEHDAFSNALKGSTSGAIVSIDDISPIEHTMKVKLSGKNLFDISKVVSSSTVINNGDGTLTVKEGSTGGVLAGTPNTLGDYAPGLEIGKRYCISFTSEGSKNWIYLPGIGNSWFSNRSYVMTQKMLDSPVRWYMDENTEGKISNIQIEEGTTATEYTPYITDMSEVVVNQFGANVVPYPYPQTTRTESGIKWTDNGDGSITANGTASTTSFFLLGGSWGQGGANKIFEDGKTYRLCSNIETSGVIVAIQTTDKSTGKLVYITNSTPFTINKSQYDYDTIMLQVTTGTTVNNLLIYACIEDVNTPEEIHKSFTPNEDGTIEGINSIYPTTTLVPDTSGVIVHCIYNKDINKVPVSGGVPAELTNKVNKNTTDIVTNRNLIDLNTRDISNLQAYLGYDDNDILGLEADFENRTFTRLAGAVGLNAGEDFNQFSIYRDRVRCNVADDGTINTIYGDVVVLCDTEVEFSAGAPEDETAENGGSVEVQLTTTPHPTDAGSAIKIYIDNVTTGESYILNSTLPHYSETGTLFTFGTFGGSNGATYTLKGWPYGDYTDDVGYVGYSEQFQFLVYPFTSDKINIKIELERDDYRDDGSNGQVMVYQPKFYYRVVPTKLEKQEGGLGYHIRKANYYISAKPKPLFKLHPAFYDENGNEVEYILYSAYEGSATDTSESGTLCSIANAKPRADCAQTRFETLSNNRGRGWHLETIKSLCATQMLMMIEFASMNIQDAIGLGVVRFPTNTTVNCASITGSTAFLGNVTGSATQTVNEISGVETTYTENGKIAISYRGVENPYGNLWKYINGINLWGDGAMLGGQAYIASDFSFDNQKRDGNYVGTGFTCTNSGQAFVSAFGFGKEEFDWLFLASESKGTSVLPVGDQVYGAKNANGYKIALSGGAWNYTNGAGAFAYMQNYGIGGKLNIFGGRLIYVPMAK